MNPIQNEFEQIIQYYVRKGELHQRAERDLRSFIAYLLEQTDYTQQRLTEIIQKVNYDTIKVHEQYDLWPELELWRGVDDYGSSPALNYGGDVEFLENEQPIVIGRYDNYTTPSDADRLRASKERNSIKIDLNKYPISLHGYFAYRFNEAALFYAWMAYLWHEIDGHTCGIKVKTVQNNSIETYSLNDFLVGDFSAFTEEDSGEKPSKLGRFFPRKLSLIELYLRASHTSYPYNPFQNYWRYFEKADAFMEIGAYEFTNCIRTGKKAESNTAQCTQTRVHENSNETLRFITEFTNKLIFDGWEEKLRPLDLPVQMHENAFDFSIWTGVNWTDDQTNRLQEKRIRDFEAQFNIVLPESFFQYLRLLNGRQFNRHHMYFPIDDLYTVKVEKFFTIEELESEAKTSLEKDFTILWIGILTEGNKLGLIVDKNSADYGRLAVEENGEVKMSAYAFERFAKYAQRAPKQPEIFAAEENDAAFLKKRIEEGWDFTTTYTYQNATTQAAEHNAHEALEVLLRAGARLNHKQHRDMAYAFDERTMELLDKYD
jgi:hypothetical protein